MEKKTKVDGKTKKIVIGVATIVAVAAITVPTALTLTSGNKDNAGANGNETNTYNIIVSTGHESVPDYNLSIEKGTTINELKSLLKAIDGYTITGIYKDEAMTQQYADNETISSSTKIYIKFVAITYTVNIYAEDGTTLLESQEVSHKDSLSLVAPTKPEDNFATYEFKYWADETGKEVSLNEITTDLNIHPYYETHMKDYRIGFINDTFKSSISVTIGGEPVNLNSTYHYGAKIVIRATQRVGRNITEFKVKVGNGEQQNILTEAYRHEENDEVYYEYELDGNGDLSITYNEAEAEYSLGTIPEGVIVTRNGQTLTSADKVRYDDYINISYDSNYDIEEFSVEGATLLWGDTYRVVGDIAINCVSTYKYAYLSFTACEGGYEITGFDNSVTEVFIPSSYKGEKVVGIKDGNSSNNYVSVFTNNTSITSVEFQSSDFRIGNYSFKGCVNLTNLLLPSNFKCIGRHAFDGCWGWHH